MDSFAFSPSINLSEGGKWLLAVSFFEATNSVFEAFQFQHQVIGLQKVVKKLLTN